MKQTLIDKFKPAVNNLSEAKLLQIALRALPDTIITRDIKDSPQPLAYIDDRVICLSYHKDHDCTISVHVPDGSKEIYADSPSIAFTYKGRDYRFN